MVRMAPELDMNIVEMDVELYDAKNRLIQWYEDELDLHDTTTWEAITTAITNPLRQIPLNR